MFGGTLFFIGLAAFFFFVYGRRKALKRIRLRRSHHRYRQAKFAVECFLILTMWEAAIGYPRAQLARFGKIRIRVRFSRAV